MPVEKLKLLMHGGLVYVAYMFRFVTPLILYPYLAKHLGLETFGRYLALYSLSLMVSIIVEYGFNLSGTREIASTTDDMEKAKIFGSVMIGRLLLYPVGIFLSIAIYACSDKSAMGGIDLLIVTIILSLGQGSTMLWFFQGILKPALGSFIEISGQLLALIAVMLLVHSSKDILSALLLQAIGIWISVAIGAVIAKKALPKITWTFQSAIEGLRSGFAIFISRGAITIYSTFSVFMIATIAGPKEAAIFGAAEKIISAGAGFLRPMAGIVLPRLSRMFQGSKEAAIAVSWKILGFITSAYCLLAIAIALLSSVIMQKFFGRVYFENASVLSMLSVTLPFIAANNFLLSQFMVSMRTDKLMLFAVLAGAAANILSALILARTFGAFGMAISRCISEGTVTLVCIVSIVLTLRAEDRRSSAKSVN